MAYKIILDPGHGGSDPGATFNGRQEKDEALGLAMSVGKLLENAGFDVAYTRTADVYNTPFEKATIANNMGGDLFVSFHRNSAPNADMYNGVQTLVYNDQGLKAELARNINENLVALGFADIGVVERPNLVVLKRTVDNEIFNNKQNEIAQAIADAIIDTLYDRGIHANDCKPNNSQSYSVQVGAFRNRQLAESLNLQLRRQGFPSRVVMEDNLFKVRVGDFRTLDNAVAMELKLRLLGYNTFVVS